MLLSRSSMTEEYEEYNTSSKNILTMIVQFTLQTIQTIHYSQHRKLNFNNPLGRKRTTQFHEFLPKLFHSGF
jgi:hypothetical protein